MNGLMPYEEWKHRTDELPQQARQIEESVSADERTIHLGNDFLQDAVTEHQTGSPLAWCGALRFAGGVGTFRSVCVALY